MKLKFTAPAARDLRAISRFTDHRWSADQRKRYVGSLYERCRWLVENPFLGKPLPVFSPNHRGYPEGSHYIVYRVVEDRLEIIRVLHQRMDIDSMVD
ncbi:type II toxin-antitoxin system RelE/ParE family toxin [Sulfidibacter corallicola]|uniref:Toxin n=1 Tax=Sulfidibacter corallicola TaxID=2818388 RepID=A0A8A4TS92_SULCO|nr:type II toxin-antitoxin system RelE/ParE family toxin [Sulfidibacter corallicola]